MTNTYLGLTVSMFALAGAAGLSQPAQAADLDRGIHDCRKGIELKVSGQINHAMLYANDGTNDDIFFVDNDTSSSRVRWKAKGHINCDWTIGATFEVEYQDNNSDKISMNQSSSADDGDFNSRKIEWWVKGPLGKLSMGQGDTASNGTSEVDQSKTSVISYSGIQTFMGGIAFVGAGNVKITDAYDQMDGMSRRNRVRYDTPTLAGFTLSTSYTDRDNFDVALRFAQEFGSLRVAAAAAYSDSNNTHVTDLGFKNQVNGSISVLHTPTGLNVTFAAGKRNDDTSGTVTDPKFHYAKLGWIGDIFPLGPTAFSVEYGRTDDRRANGDKLHSYGATIVQHIPHVGTEFYAAIRTHEFERVGFTDPDNVWGITSGARVKF